jgi:hypothetical protein
VGSGVWVGIGSIFVAVGRGLSVWGMSVSSSGPGLGVPGRHAARRRDSRRRIERVKTAERRASLIK